MTQTEKNYYKDAANFLRSIGVSVTYKGNRKSTPQQRAAVTKYFNRYGGYKNDRTLFIKKPRSTVRALRGVVSKDQITPRGVIMVVPRGVDKRAFRYKVVGRGKGAYLETRVSKQRVDRTVSLDPIKLATDPIKAARDAIAKVHPEALKLNTRKLTESLRESIKEVGRVDKKKTLPVGIKIVVAGNEQRGGSDFATFFSYFSDLYADKDNAHGRRENPTDPQAFSDLFNLKLIYNEF